MEVQDQGEDVEGCKSKVIGPQTFLFVPASRPDRIDKALDSSADVVIIDLEDAVRIEDKDESRSNLAQLEPSRKAYVRINDDSTDHFRRDVRLISGCSWVSAVVLPKVESPKQVKRLLKLTKGRIEVIALVETARGIIASDEIAKSGVSRLMFGSVDYAVEMGSQPNEKLFAYPRSRLVVASAAAGLAAPVDGPTAKLNDAAELIEQTRTAILLGMGGKLCIHPDQIKSVAPLFISAKDEEWALKILSAHRDSKSGVFVLNGEMIDAPQLALARKILKC